MIFSFHVCAMDFCNNSKCFYIWNHFSKANLRKISSSNEDCGTNTRNQECQHEEVRSSEGELAIFYVKSTKVGRFCHQLKLKLQSLLFVNFIRISWLRVYRTADQIYQFHLIHLFSKSICNHVNCSPWNLCFMLLCIQHIDPAQDVTERKSNMSSSLKALDCIDFGLHLKPLHIVFF